MDTRILHLKIDAIAKELGLPFLPRLRVAGTIDTGMQMRSNMVTRDLGHGGCAFPSLHFQVSYGSDSLFMVLLKF